MRFVASIALLASLVLGPGCSCSAKRKTPGNETAASSVGDAGTRPVRRPPMMSRGLGQITLEEVAGLLPMPEGARTLEEPHKSPIAERVEATYCVTKDLTVTGDDLKARLSTAGWQGVSTRPHPSIKERLGVVGKKAPYMLTGSLQHSQDPRCSGAKGEVLVSMGVHKLEEKRSEAALPPLRPTESDWKARPDGTIYIPGRTAAPTRVSPGLQGAKPSMPSAPTKTQ